MSITPFDNEPEKDLEIPQAESTPEVSPSPDEIVSAEVVPETREVIVSSDEIISDEAASDGRTVEDLTVAELFRQFWSAPGETWYALMQVLQTPRNSDGVSVGLLDVPLSGSGKPARLRFNTSLQKLSSEERAVRQREAARLGLRIIGLLVALYGNQILATQRTEEMGLNVGVPFLLAGFVLWFAGELYYLWQERKHPVPLHSLVTEDKGVASEAASVHDFGDTTHSSVGDWGMRLMLASGGLVFCVLTGAFTVSNRFRLEGVITWAISILLWVLALAPLGWGWNALVKSIRKIRIRTSWTFWAMLLIMLMAAYFRLTDLNGTPPEMTSDHVEKLLDSQRILDGNPQVFFPNNGGREPIQFYLMAIVSHLPGLGMNFFTLKLLTVVEGLLTIPVMWWMGREIIGPDEPELGNFVGLIMAALVTVSYWHEMLSRLGLRIVLTVLFTGLLVIYLSRGLRYNRRGDFIRAGLTLGFGVYAYQAVRMLPVVVILGIVLAVLFNWLRKKKEERQTVRYINNLAVLVILALVVFVPLMTFSLQYPDDFWRRTSGRILGDDLIQTTNEKGEIVQRVASLEERVAAFQKNISILFSNIRNALLMYNWKGDVAWITSAPNFPEMDVYTGTLLIVGLSAWLWRMVKRRDAADWLMPPMLFIMLLPSALSLAYPVENPSATRTSGTLPVAYLFAALPLALLVLSVKRLMPGRAGVVASGGLVGLVVLMAWGANWNTYFNDYRNTYLASSPAPYTEAGSILRGFVESGGDFGNAFLLAYPYWWDHRAVGIEAGVMDWPNGIADPDLDGSGKLPVDDLPKMMYEDSLRADRYHFDPEKDILIFYSINDTVTPGKLAALFPTGYPQVIHSYKPGDDFMLFRVPRLGTQGFIDFAVRTGAANS